MWIQKDDSTRVKLLRQIWLMLDLLESEYDSPSLDSVVDGE